MKSLSKEEIEHTALGLTIGKLQKEKLFMFFNNVILDDKKGSEEIC